MLRFLSVIVSLACLGLQLAPAQAQPAARDELLRQELPRATLVTAEALEDLDDLLEPAVFRVRTTTDLGRNFRPRFSEADGVATLVQIAADEPPVLITAFAHVAQATTVEIEIADAWHPVQVRHGTVMFDLAELVLDSEAATAIPANVTAALDPAHALPLARAWPYGATLFCPALTDDAAAHLRSDGNPDVLLGTLGPSPREPFQFYTRATFTARNGYPIVAIDGQLLAVSSLPANDRIGGVLVIPFTYINAWHDEWDQLRDESPLGWVPRVRYEDVELESGDDALR